MVHQRPLGETGLTISEIGLGALEMGAKYGIGEDAGEIPSEDEAIALLRTAMESGVTFFDSAGAYGLSELRIGKFLKTTRERPVLATKLMVRPADGGRWLDYAAERPYPNVEACVDHQVERSLRNLGVGTIDLVQLHGLPEDELFDRMTAALRRHVDAGRIRVLGASCGGDAVPKLAGAGYGSVQLACNMLDQREFKSGLRLAEQHGMGVLIRIPLALGVLAGRASHIRGPDERRRRFEPLLAELQAKLPAGMTVPEAALRFLLTSPAVTSVLTGTRRGSHIQANARAGDGKGLPQEIFEWLRGLADHDGLPQWSWGEHYREDWPTNSHEANLALCRSVDEP